MIINNKYIVNTDVLNIRNDPSLRGDIVGKLTRGSEVSGYYKIGNWIQIDEFDSRWVCIGYLLQFG
jgi:N-acetylmuramoyl-L-alanine amidase